MLLWTFVPNKVVRVCVHVHVFACPCVHVYVRALATKTLKLAWNLNHFCQNILIYTVGSKYSSIMSMCIIWNELKNENKQI